MYRRMRSIETMNFLSLTGYGLKMLKWYLPVRKLLRAPMPEGLEAYTAEPGLARVFCAEAKIVAGLLAGIGWLARATGTVFIERVARKAAEQRDVFRTRLLAGHKLLFFPEGTSSDGLRVLPFKTSLFSTSAKKNFISRGV